MSSSGAEHLLRSDLQLLGVVALDISIKYAVFQYSFVADW